VSVLTRAYSRATHELRYFLLRRLPTCKDVTPILSESLERPLTLRERIVVRVHLWICIWCEWYLDQLHEIRDACRARGGAEEPGEPTGVAMPDDAKERIRRALEDRR
jgi:hypothetical protein